MEQQDKKAVAEAVANQLADAIVSRLEKSNSNVDFHTNPDFRAWLDERIDNKARTYMVGFLIAYMLPILGGVFTGGLLYSKVDQALDEQFENTKTLYARGGFVRDQQNFNCRVLRHLEGKTDPDFPLGPCLFDSAASPDDVRR